VQSELHERLEYLVNYSSQLIFVSGESIAEQQKTLEAFVFQQHDDTEIAYLTAQDNMDISDYRRQLCRQLLGQVVGSFVRPLNELLSDLNKHNGPILIAITQAQHLPDKLLQELWDLVLQSRFAGNKQHLNVLLFANSAWAEKAKQWLPAKNTETPLIISSQSVMSEQPRFESDLDKMIASRREAFQAHLENRQQENALTFSNPLKSKWLYIGLFVVFLATFCGLVYWQYGEKLSSLFEPINGEPASTEAQQAAPGSAYNSLVDSSGAATSQASPDITKGVTLEIVEQTQTGTDSNAISDSNTQLVTDWDDAISSLAASEGTAEKNAAQLDNEQNVDTNEQVPDETTPLSNAQQSNSSPVQDEPQQVVLDEPQLNDTAWITADLFAIQMLAMKDEAVLSDFIDENSLSDVSRIYKTQRYGGDWFVVVSKQTYSSLQEAREAQANLPNYPGKNNAFVKRGSQILSEIALSQ